MIISLHLEGSATSSACPPSGRAMTFHMKKLSPLCEGLYIEVSTDGCYLDVRVGGRGRDLGRAISSRERASCASGIWPSVGPMI